MRLLSALIALSMAVAVAMFMTLLLGLQPQLDHQVNADIALQRLNQGMLDEESDARAYLAVRDYNFLQRYQAGKQLADGGSAQVRDLVVGDPSLAASFVDLTLAQQAWSSEWLLPTIAEPPLPGDAQAIQAAIARDKELFTRYENAETALSQQLQGRINATTFQERLVYMLGLVLEGGVWAGLVVIGIRRYRHLGDAVVRPVGDLLRNIGRVAHGDLSADFEPVGPRELCDLAHGLAEMSASLVTERELSGAREAEIRAQAERFRQIIAISRDVAGSLNLHYVVRATARSARGITGFPRVIVWLTNEAERRLVPLYDTDLASGAPMELEPIDLGEDIAGRAAKYGRLVTLINAEDSFAGVGDSAGTVAVAAMPMIMGARIVGVIELRSTEAMMLSGDDLDSLEMLSTQAATAVEAARLHSDSEERSQTDALTGLLNRRRLDQDLSRESAWALEHHRPLSFIMLDVDDFKRFNDTYGHQHADEVLQELAAVLTAAVRSSDSVYRYGGEELAVLLRDTSVDRAVGVAEWLRVRIQERFQRIMVTASFGVAEIPNQALTPGELVASADTAMYAAKKGGRNTVRCANPRPSGGGFPVADEDLPPEPTVLPGGAA